jgi:formylglycine-generating enzyme required for sulfatase activity
MFRCLVSNGAGSVYTSAVSLSVSTTSVAPSITLQPQNQTVSLGDSATFKITASGTDLVYQWQKNGVNIMGALSVNYTTPAVSWTDNGAAFRCVVTNGIGNIATSSWAYLTVQGKTTDSMAYIPAGVFQMGSMANPSELPLHMVTLSGFSMSNTEVTLGEYLRVMGVNPSTSTTDTSRPVENLTWFDAVLYCNARSMMEARDTVYSYFRPGLTGTPGSGCTALPGLAVDTGRNGYRLPMEAEWEYACRADHYVTDYYWEKDYPPMTASDTADLDNNSWWRHNSTAMTHPSAWKQPNPYGLRDMAGNVAEWCNDWSGAYTNIPNPQIDPVGPSVGSMRVVRGGAFSSGADSLRCASRMSNTPGTRANWLGFRVVYR